jgi:ERF superfamily
MQRSSETIGALAAALAKAQCELTNPERSLTATIPAAGRGSADKAFRYASLASGLDIVRRVLGQHEIATMQTTAVDQAAGIVNLTTVLAHSSGEWMASDWPVCPVSDTASPKRMGMALTYARRYSLFALAGITGEDDLDAPDLDTPTSTTTSGKEPAKLNGTGLLNGGYRHHDGGAPPRRNGKVHPPRQTLGTEASAELRDRLLQELNSLGSADDAALWAHRSLADKNKLTAADAQRIEEAFEARLSSLLEPQVAIEDPQKGSRPDRSKTPRRRARSDAVDKSVLTLPEPRRVRDRDHVRFVATHPCLICGRQPCDAHHLRFMQNRALGRKVSDEFTVPVCRGHHREVHRRGDEAAWWEKTGIDPVAAARSLWLESRPLPLKNHSLTTRDQVTDGHQAKLQNEPNSAAAR